MSPSPPPLSLSAPRRQVFHTTAQTLRSTPASSHDYTAVLRVRATQGSKMLTRKIKLWDINAHITCRLCNGYLIDATTVTECLHTCTYQNQNFKVSICLECNSSKLRGLKRKWIRCSAQATVLHLKKFIAKKLNLASFNELDILCNEEILGKDHTLKFVVVTRWRFKKSPLLLHYRPKMDLL
ncbi:polycomb group RING finger protein 3 [Rhincodon typus]|uniref:polycomb group RING finger protein 3 n=1 Tax=Rhincodon typus TaxID=259920 RepID=UPI00202F94B4|nr:polycomb group RING finger protein 3 [Rhincodon typus]